MAKSKFEKNNIMTHACTFMYHTTVHKNLINFNKRGDAHEYDTGNIKLLNPPVNITASITTNNIQFKIQFYLIITLSI